METLAKIPVTKIELYRAEGPTKECGPAGPFNTWEEADRRLAIWATTAPENGGYDKVDFTITFADGETYKGRYDLQRHGEDGERGFSIAKHVKSHVAFLAHKPKCPGFFKTHVEKDDADTAIEAKIWLDERIPEGVTPSRFWCCDRKA